MHCLRREMGSAFANSSMSKLSRAEDGPDACIWCLGEERMVLNLGLGRVMSYQLLVKCRECGLSHTEKDAEDCFCGANFSFGHVVSGDIPLGVIVIWDEEEL